MIPRLMIAGVGSGSGKTVITCGLLRLLAGLGKKAAAFKCGPDYIDPMFHKEILGIPSKNLDTFFTGEELTKGLFLEDAAAADLSVIEGVMGLYDGLLGIKEEASSYHLAKTLKTPVVLVVNAHGMGRSLLPLIAGFLQYDPEHLIRGIILNRLGRMFYDTVRPEIEEKLGVKVLGYLPETEALKLESRHLGLKLPGEITNLRKQTEDIAAVLKQTLDINGLMRIAETAGELHGPTPGDFSGKYRENGRLCISEGSVPIGIALDEAFCFYYEDNLRLLRRMGAEPVFFSPLKDAELPAGIKGLLLGGGYPELYAEELSANRTMRDSVAAAIRKGMPSAAECGGFMYLHDEIITDGQKAYQMTGAIKGSCHNTGRLVRFGYAELSEKKPIFLDRGGTVKGHEFHYYDSTDNGRACRAKKPLSDRSWDCVHAADNKWWGFPHLYYYSNPDYAAHFVERALNYGKTKKGKE